MFKKILLPLFLAVLVTVAGYNIPAGHKASASPLELQKLAVVEQMSAEDQASYYFQREYNEKIDAVLAKVFPLTLTTEDENGVHPYQTVNMEALDEQASAYYDTVKGEAVFTLNILDENTPEMIQIKQELKSLLGDKLVVKKAKHGLKKLKKIKVDVANDIPGNINTGLNVWEEKIIIEADISSKMQQELVDKYGDVFEFKPYEGGIADEEIMYRSRR
ncbi:hypothetical protein B1A99_20090 [Cohnella sp. CIP 111063]|uniref:hypothetical protein n=1 Tax=unclassified Cohnella TaxID=2636738 RepID=UPI000B8BD1E9|nr:MULTISPECIES: hypothetical protein [unclassified Cohnella]OXS56625.1 hypothetical protein B1A99_20090 [Cohnella sp. CIP 111063]PRX68812.1 hypothetical protein B0G52_113142 [Cohnella sp. SGD-V74]